ncbi:MAG: MarR family transcriptional regulator [Clostridia bacterium]|nr:MarR family transcriptional regulator [Clostridia bacterium]
MSENERMKEEQLTQLLRICGRRLYHSSCAGRTQARVLRLLLEEGKISQREIQERLNIQAGSISELISKLEGKGFIRRSRDEADRRKVLLSLTAEGRRAAEKAKARPDVTVRYAALTEQEQEQLQRLLEKLIDGWKEDGMPESELTLCGTPGMP